MHTDLYSKHVFKAMALNGKFTCFNELTDDVKRAIVNHFSTQDFLRFMSSGKIDFLTQKEIKTKLRQMRKGDDSRACNILRVFTTECLELQRKFANQDVRNAHFDMFLKGYPQSKLLEHNEMFEQYNNTFENLVYDLLHVMRNNQTSNTAASPVEVMNVINTLRFKKDLNERAKPLLFKPVMDDCVEHELSLEFESGININVVICICKSTSDPMPTIDVRASIDSNKSGKQYKLTYVISEEQDTYDSEDDYDENAPIWINNDPFDWITIVMKNVQRINGKKSMLGYLKQIKYTYHGEQFWEKAYFLLEVLPKLEKM